VASGNSRAQVGRRKSTGRRTVGQLSKQAQDVAFGRFGCDAARANLLRVTTKKKDRKNFKNFSPLFLFF
jgi:hypothetical protein